MTVATTTQPYPCDRAAGVRGWHSFQAGPYGTVCTLCGLPAKESPAPVPAPTHEGRRIPDTDPFVQRLKELEGRAVAEAAVNAERDAETLRLLRAHLKTVGAETAKVRGTNDRDKWLPAQAVERLTGQLWQIINRRVQ